MKDISANDPRIKALPIKLLIAYLEKTGWKRIQHSNENMIVFEGREDDEGNPIRLVLPRRDDFQDSYLRLADAINLLAGLQNRSPEEVIEGIQSKPIHRFRRSKVDRLWLVEIWKQQREVFKKLVEHVLSFMLLIGTLITLHYLFQVLHLPPQYKELLERIDFYGIALVLVVFGFSFLYKLVAQAIEATTRKTQASKLLKLQMGRILTQMNVPDRQMVMYIEQELYKMERQVKKSA